MKKRKNRKKSRSNLKIGLAILLFVLVALLFYELFFSDKYKEKKNAVIDASKPDIEVALLSVNPYSRPGLSTNKIRNIVVHYTANPGSTAMGNRNYFEGLKDSKITQASSNFVVGLEGEIVQCVPTWEVAYASNDRNLDSVSIEFCHLDESGVPNEDTYNSLVHLCAWLCLKFELNEEDIIRHFDVSGKNCPKYFVEDEAAFIAFKEDVKAAIDKGDQSLE